MSMQYYDMGSKLVDFLLKISLQLSCIAGVRLQYSNPVTHILYNDLLYSLQSFIFSFCLGAVICHDFFDYANISCEFTFWQNWTDYYVECFQIILAYLSRFIQLWFCLVDRDY